jgi:hypothetical protein
MPGTNDILLLRVQNNTYAFSSIQTLQLIQQPQVQIADAQDINPTATHNHDCYTQS